MMEAVKAFNAELQSLYETKPPISKAKMTLITRSAMKAIKFYKHVVQSVEKFIQKCKPEYKVPGLYVIDSIVRQSRHQYTPEKDVFAPRFSRNIKTTFLHLFNCSQEDKSKIVRVLNLWQKNNVFTAEVIQPLLDLAASVANKDTLAPNGVQSKTPPNSQQPINRTPNSKSSPTKDPAWLTAGRNQVSENNNTDSKSINAAASKVKIDKKLFEYDYGEDDDDDRVASPIRANQVPPSSVSQSQQQAPLPNLESLSSILSNPEVLRQLHTLQQQMAARQQQQELDEKMRRLQEMKHQEEEFDRHLAQTVPKLPFAAECELQPSLNAKGSSSVSASGGGVNLPSGVAPPSGVMPPTSVPPPSAVPLPSVSISEGLNQSSGMTMPPAFLSQIDLPPLMVQPPPVPPPSFSSQPTCAFPSMDASDRPPVDYDERTRQPDLSRNMKENSMDENEMGNDDSIEVIDLVRSPDHSRDSEHRRYRNRSRSKDRYSRRSRSRSRSRRRHRSRSRSRSSDRDERDDREYDSRKHREVDREKERERKKKGLPPMRRSHLTVCSTTLWIGHLSKLIHEDQLSNIFGEYGDIVSINLIPPRGCAFICMNRRQDAMKALQQLKHYKIQSKTITVAWAPGKGMKDKEWKDYWEVEHGASFIPWNKLSPKTNFELLEEGGMLDQDTFPDWLKETYSNLKKQQEERKAKEEEEKKVKGEELPPLPSGPQPPPVAPTSAQPDLRGQPPPQPPPPTPLPPPPMGILPPPPFSLQPPSLLGPMGMTMPPGLVGPLGVPPPIMVPQQMIPRMPPPFNPPQSFGLMDGMPPPPLPTPPNPFGPPIITPPQSSSANTNNNNNTISSNSCNKDETEMDVVDDSEEETPTKKETLSPSQGRGGSPLERRNEERPPLIPNAPVLPPDFNPVFPNNRHPSRPGVPGQGGGEDDDGVYPAAMIEFPPRDFPPRDFPPRDFIPPPHTRGGPLPPPGHFFNPRGGMFGPRGPPPGPGPMNITMNMRPSRHPLHPGMGGAGDVRGGWVPPQQPGLPPLQQLPPPRGGARFSLLHPPPPLAPPNRRGQSERKSRWGEPVDQTVADMFPGHNPEENFLPEEMMFTGPPPGVDDRFMQRPPGDVLPATLDSLLGPPPHTSDTESPDKMETGSSDDIEPPGGSQPFQTDMEMQSPPTESDEQKLTLSPTRIEEQPPPPDTEFTDSPLPSNNENIAPSNDNIDPAPVNVLNEAPLDKLDDMPVEKSENVLPNESTNNDSCLDDILSSSNSAVVTSPHAHDDVNVPFSLSGLGDHCAQSPKASEPGLSNNSVENPNKSPIDMFSDRVQVDLQSAPNVNIDLFSSPSKVTTGDNKVSDSNSALSEVKAEETCRDDHIVPGVSLYSPEATLATSQSDLIEQPEGSKIAIEDVPPLIPVTGVIFPSENDSLVCGQTQSELSHHENQTEAQQTV